MFNGRHVFAVAQKPFATEGAWACSLRPLQLNDDADLEQKYPRCGLVKWWFQKKDLEFAIPGSLVEAEIENAPHYDKNNPKDMMYHVKWGSIGRVDENTLVEVVKIDDDEIQSIRDVTGLKFYVLEERPVSPVVVVEWRDKMYGPFDATSYPDQDAGERFKIKFKTHWKDGVVSYGARDDIVTSLDDDYVTESDVVLSLDPAPPGRNRAELRCDYTLVLGGIDAFLDACGDRTISARPFGDTIREVCDGFKKSFTKTEWQQLSLLIDETERKLRERQREYGDEYYEALADLAQLRTTETQLIDELKKAIIQSGCINKALEDEVKHRVDELAKKEKERFRREALKEERVLYDKLKTLREEERLFLKNFKVKKRETEKKLEQELKEKSRELEKECRQQKAELEAERKQISREKEELQRMYTDVKPLQLLLR